MSAGQVTRAATAESPETALARQVVKTTERIPVDQLPQPVQDWLANVAVRSANTHDAYHLAVSLWIRWALSEGIDVNAPTLANAEAWVRYLVDERGNALRSANARVAAVSSFYNRLRVENRVQFNPFAAITSVKITTSKLKTPAVSAYNVKQMLALAAKESHAANHAVMELLFTTGARAFEIGEAKIGDMRADEHGAALHVIRKGLDEQDLPVTPKALAAIKKANTGRGVLADDAPLLVGPRGKRYSRHTISRLVHRVAVGAGLDVDLAKLVTAHTTRRTVATQLIKKDEPMRNVQTLLGHKDPRTTEGYIRAEVEREAHASAALTLSTLFH